MAFLSPWFIGGNYPFTRTVLVGGCGLALLLVIAKLFSDLRSDVPYRMRVPLIWWVLLAGVGFTFFQASPHSESRRGWQRFFQPNLRLRACYAQETGRFALWGWVVCRGVPSVARF